MYDILVIKLTSVINYIKLRWELYLRIICILKVKPKGVIITCSVMLGIRRSQNVVYHHNLDSFEHFLKQFIFYVVSEYPLKYFLGVNEYQYSYNMLCTVI